MSSEVSATPQAAPLAAPTLTATAGNRQVTLSWTADAGASYSVYRGTSSGGETQIAYGITGTSFTDTGLNDNLTNGPALTNGTTYYYQVAAVSENFSPAVVKSSEVSATPHAPLITPTVTWAAPAAITYGTALSATQLDATASVPGTFAYTPAAGTVLGAGTQTLDVTFTPTDTTDYTTASKTATLTVNKATPIDHLGHACRYHLRHRPERNAARRHGQRPRHLRLYTRRWHGTDRRHPDALGHLHADRHHRLRNRQQEHDR